MSDKSQISKNQNCVPKYFFWHFFLDWISVICPFVGYCVIQLTKIKVPFFSIKKMCKVVIIGQTPMGKLHLAVIIQPVYCLLEKKKKKLMKKHSLYTKIKAIHLCYYLYFSNLLFEIFLEIKQNKTTTTKKTTKN